MLSRVKMCALKILHNCRHMRKSFLGQYRGRVGAFILFTLSLNTSLSLVRCIRSGDPTVHCSVPDLFSQYQWKLPLHQGSIKWGGGWGGMMNRIFRACYKVLTAKFISILVTPQTSYKVKWPLRFRQVK